MYTQPLPYSKHSAELFKHFADLPWSLWLDSAHPYSQQGRFDILAALPTKIFMVQNGKIHFISKTSHEVSTENPFEFLKKQLPKISSPQTDFPCTGGFLGYFSYDLGLSLENIAPKNCSDIKMPDCALGFYPGVIINDHLLQSCHFVSALPKNLAEAYWQQLKAKLVQPVKSIYPFKLASSFQSNLSYQAYEQALDKIFVYLKAGDCYQVNFTQRFSADFSGSPWQAYLALREKNPAPFGGFFNTPYGCLLSASPERFLQIHNQVIETKPIKGTKARHSDLLLDKQSAQDLLQSPKDRSENLMIVDLLRNDLGKFCQAGSVKVPEFCKLESFAHVHHLVSKIQGQLCDDVHHSSALGACFPGGSITGAPKIRAMQIIEELEPNFRSLYCGSLGYMDLQGNLDFNILIRTAILYKNKIHCAAGGAIVYDSDIKAEYQESCDKIEKMLNIFYDLSKG